jgi:hypothetical protein
MKPQIFSTRDLYLATTLVCLRFYLVGIDYQIEGDRNNPVGYFKFEDCPEIQEARNRYNQGLLLVEPKLFVTNLKSLKSEIINIYKNPHLASEKN